MESTRIQNNLPHMTGNNKLRWGTFTEQDLASIQRGLVCVEDLFQWRWGCTPSTADLASYSATGHRGICRADRSRCMTEPLNHRPDPSA